jgi:pyrophosphatase PpaX
MTKNTKCKFDAVIFDIDGTLASTNRLIFASFNYVMDKYSGKTLTDEEIIGLFGPPEDVILKEFFNSKYELVREDYYKFYKDNHELMVKRFDTMHSLLNELNKTGIPMGVFTGKGLTSSLITLKMLNMDRYFNNIITGDDVNNYKPSGEGIKTLMNEFNVEGLKTLMIGDAPSDILAARDAGCLIASCTWDSYAEEQLIKMKPDFLVNNIHELAKILFN